MIPENSAKNCVGWYWLVGKYTSRICSAEDWWECPMVEDVDILIQNDPKDYPNRTSVNKSWLKISWL